MAKVKHYSVDECIRHFKGAERTSWNVIKLPQFGKLSCKECGIVDFLEKSGYRVTSK